ncbi:hypothetical protein FE257_002068 [Aspergillus nanangensis]|uniref:Zn(2)-C6 fungal-type domain-containing protein n=1 Tax=Aspergillus nanangensis TaxID=2582783 RepID=A0AAD4CT93_ASPNN|nr:hypothetical protein FE257_002068 [Aspergillus nanangensis]
MTRRRDVRSCTECARRKIKCDQASPCGACARRGRHCAPQRRPVSYPARNQELSVLQHRLCMLEARLSEPNPGQSPSRPEPECQERLLMTLESLSYGQPSTSPESSIDSLYQSERPLFLLLLPDKESSNRIIDWALANLTWIHCALRIPVFQQEHNAFWEAMEAGNESIYKEHGWLSVYFSLLAAGLLYMDPVERPLLQRLRSLQGETKPLGSDGSADETIARLWYETALSELGTASPLLQPRLSTVQAIAVLTLCHGHFGQTEREYILLGMAINTARVLDMHLLSSEDRLSRRVAANPHWTTPEDRQMGRRLWWTLVICDWLGPFSRPSSISATSFNTILEPRPSDNDDLVPNPSAAGFSAVWHHLTVSRLASIVYTHIQAPRDPSGTRLALALDQIDAVEESLAQGRSQRRSTTGWAAWQEYLLTHTVQLLRVTIARAVMVLWLMDRADITSTIDRGLNAAVRILDMRRSPVPRPFKCHWIITASTLAAGVFLAVHLVCFKSQMALEDIAEHRRLVQLCIDALRTSHHKTGITVQGAQQLERLLAMELCHGTTVFTDKSSIVAMLGGLAPGETVVSTMSSVPPTPPSDDPVASSSHSPDLRALDGLWPEMMGDFSDAVFPDLAWPGLTPPGDGFTFDAMGNDRLGGGIGE